jgi:hypothetical protein
LTLDAGGRSKAKFAPPGMVKARENRCAWHGDAYQGIPYTY